MNKNRLIQTFFDLARIDSPSGEEKKIVEYLCNFLRENKLVDCVVKDQLGNIIASIKGKGNPLFISAHMDTVEPGRNIVPKIDGKVICSDGNTILGADNKIAVAAILELLLDFRDHPEREHRSLEIVFTVSEESGNYGALALDYSKISAKEGYLFDVSAPVGTIITASPFYNRFDVHLQGKSAHASRPEEANNSVSVLGFVLNKINLGKVSSDTIVNIGLVTTGEKESSRNTIPGEMVIKGEVRSYVEKELEQVSEKIKNAFKEAVESYGSSAKIEFCRENGGYKYSPEHPWVKRAVEKICEVGLKPVFKEAWGCSDGNIFMEKGLTVLNLGDGTRDSHTKKESISIKELDNLYRLITALVV